MYTLGDVLRQRTLANEDNVPDDLFAIQIEFDRELYHCERVVNARLDNKAHIEISVGKHWWSYAEAVLHIPKEARRKYNHISPNGRIVRAWGYPMKYLPAFRRWLRDVYFPVHFAAYVLCHVRRIGAEAVRISAKTVRTQLQLARYGMTQLSLFSEALA